MLRGGSHLGRLSSTYDRYLDALRQGDASRAMSALEQGLARGESPRRLLRVISAAQEHIGDLWSAGQWTAFDEHVATATAQRCLAAVAPPRATPAGVPEVFIVCPEGEWHTMPAQLAAAAACWAAVDIVTVAGSLPSEDLYCQLVRRRPVAVGVSVTMPVNLLSAARTIRAVHRAGLPVIAGGAAWGSDRRARRLGADLYLDDPEQLGLILPELPRDVRPDPQLPPEAELLDTAPSHLLSDAAFQLLSRDARATSTSTTAAVVTDLGWLCRSAAASLATEDAAIVRQSLVPTRATPGLVAAGIPPTRAALALAEVIADVSPQGSALLRRSAEELTRTASWGRVGI